ITEQGAAGWEFAGSERVRDEKAGANVLVLVFRKRPVAAPVAVRPEGTPFGATDPTVRAIRGAGLEVRPEGATTGADRTTATAPAAGHSARFRLTHAKADETAKALDDLFRGTGVLAAPEAATNSVVVRAPAAEWMTNVRRAVELLDRAAPPAGRPTVITLGGVSAVEAVNLLGQLFPEATGARITAGAQTNALHVSGPPAVVEQIQGICRRLDAGRLAPGNRP
ncbi:hypothetical protein J0H58_18820, partial [bacterium]|nr:hypothetical protein [bacterium]